MGPKNTIPLFHLQIPDRPLFGNRSRGPLAEGAASQKDLLDRIGDKQKNHAQNGCHQEERPFLAPIPIRFSCRSKVSIHPAPIG